MLDELRFHIKSFTRLLYVQTDEEDRFLHTLKKAVKKKSVKISVFNNTMGLHPIDTVISDWQTKNHPMSDKGRDQNALFEEIYKEKPGQDTHIYVITDPDRWLPDLQIQRRLLNVVHSLHNDNNTVKILIFVGARRVIPEKLSKYIDVVIDKGLVEEDVQHIVAGACSDMQVPVPPDPMRLFRGMNSWEIESALAQAIISNHKKTGKYEVDEHYIGEYRRKSLRKSDLLSYVDTSEYSFDQVGGLHRFKEWVQRTKACWTEEGREFGLTPPKGVLAVGVWGCGKSLSVKAMGQAWGLPVVSMEMGKLRGMAQGASEQNVYMALNLIERVAPCIVWLDEAEKSLSGGQSSAMTDGGTTNRMIGIFSTWLQETNAPVTLALTANSLATMPIEFVNRMDERFFFDMPANKDRIEILKIQLAKLKRDPKAYSLAMLAEKAEGLVGREIEHAVKAALRDSFHAGCKSLSEEILAADLVKRPRISKTMADEIQSLKSWVGYDPESNDGIRARFAADPQRGPLAAGGGLDLG